VASSVICSEFHCSDSPVMITAPFLWRVPLCVQNSIVVAARL
jgi:hypothetical protein